MTAAIARRSAAALLLLLCLLPPRPASRPVPPAAALAASAPASAPATQPLSAVFYAGPATSCGQVVVPIVARPGSLPDPPGRWIAWLRLSSGLLSLRPFGSPHEVVATDLGRGCACRSVQAAAPFGQRVVAVDVSLPTDASRLRAVLLWLVCRDWLSPVIEEVRLYREPRVAQAQDLVAALLGTLDSGRAALLIDCDPNGDGLCDADDIQAWVNRQGSGVRGQ